MGSYVLCAPGSQEGSSLDGTTKPTSMKTFLKVVIVKSLLQEQ